MPPAWGVEALANAGLATDSCCMKREGAYLRPRWPWAWHTCRAAASTANSTPGIRLDGQSDVHRGAARPRPRWRPRSITGRMLRGQLSAEE
jgi:hypothetical protein